MISEPDNGNPSAAAPVLWITGLASSGKSTLAARVLTELRSQGLRPLLLDGDAVRHALDHEQEERHDVSERKRRAWRIARLARLVSEQGIPVVVATISLFHEVQSWTRAACPRYAEVVLVADLANLHARKPDVYGRAVSDQPVHVVGRDIAAEFPKAPELLIRQTFDHQSLDRHCAQVMVLWESLWTT